jgi:vanillate O-demethylase ferredoxin subunit
MPLEPKPQRGPATISRVVRVARKTVEALDICSFELVDRAGAALPAFSAGSHLDVRVGSRFVRQYSLCNAPAETHRYLIAVLREPRSRGGSTAMHALEVGQLVGVSTPKNHFPLFGNARHSVLVAGGIGITPILSMAEHLASLGASFELHYCTRSMAHTAFADRIRGSAFGDRTHFHLDGGPLSQRLGLAALVARRQADQHLYLCGPAGFMDWLLSAARAGGWPEDQLHREHFSAPGIDATSNGSFEVQIASTGVVICVRPEQTVATALAEVGIDVPTACSQGVCGTCLTRVLEGTPEHRDLYLTPDQQAAGDRFTPCCSRAKSARLLLDL